MLWHCMRRRNVFLVSIESGLLTEDNSSPTHAASTTWIYVDRTPKAADAEWKNGYDRAYWWDVAFVVITEIHDNQIVKERTTWTEIRDVPETHKLYPAICPRAQARDHLWQLGRGRTGSEVDGV